MEKNLKKFIIRMMVNETNPDFVLKLLLQDSNIVNVVGKALISDIQINEIMNILSNEAVNLSERIAHINDLTSQDNIKNYVKR